ncbi:NTP transferase domain-containing protein [Crocinitomicaceae bacterium]|nr:NTP transferase domain-containing protein [Crocinitomicaceae bacterium]
MTFTLLILAGGLGSRFNGTKQLHGIGPNGELLMEYSIHDAIKNGCSKVVVLSNHKCIPELKIKLSYLTSKIKVDYVDQFKFDPAYPNYRRRPWGTGHAVLSCAKLISEPFLLINADDFYGHDAYLKAKQILRHIDFQTYGMIAYKLKNTLSNFGSVSRGVCITHDDELLDVNELMGIKFHDKIITCDQKNVELDGTQFVSMNLWILNPSIFIYLKKAFEVFYDINKDAESEELFLPTVINDLIKGEHLSVCVSPTDSSWFGLTYAKDIVEAKISVSALINKGEYPLNIES